MDLKGSLVDTNVKLYPTKNLLDFLQKIPIEGDTPTNICKLIKGKDYEQKQTESKDVKPIQLDDIDIENLTKIKEVMSISHNDSDEAEMITDTNEVSSNEEIPEKSDKSDDPSKDTSTENSKNSESDKTDKFYLTTPDIDWLYTYLQTLKSKGEKNVPYLNFLLEGAQVEMPDNKMMKRNPVLEARCVKLRAQQEAREYRKMTKTVDNVRMRFPEDSISYQLKQVNRQLIAIGQFIISIFAGFLFGFRGVEWMVGNLDFGFRLLLGVMCALVIALAEIYFLAKKLNEELNIPETIQLGGPPKFANEPSYMRKVPSEAIDKEHQD